MESKVYKYMDWPEIEAVVYAEEASPKDLMAPRLTADGILIQGFFPDAEKAEVLVDKKAYEMEKQDDAGYFAAMIPGRKIPAYQYRITRGKETRTLRILMHSGTDYRSRRKSFLCRCFLSCI